MQRISRTTVVAALIALLLVAVACGDDEEETPSPSASLSGTVTRTRTATPGTTVPAGSPSPTDEPFSGARDPVQVTATPGMTQAQLKDVRAAEHTSFDRFTLEFDSEPPGYRVPGYKVEYVTRRSLQTHREKR